MEEEVKSWIRKAEEDYELAEDNFDMDHEPASMFFCHQSVEKAIKALQLTENSKSFSHNLVALAKEEDIDDRFLEVFADLNPFYTGFRYPDEDSPEIENPEEVLEKVGEFLEWTKKQLKK